MWPFTKTPYTDKYTATAIMAGDRPKREESYDEARTRKAEESKAHIPERIEQLRAADVLNWQAAQDELAADIAAYTMSAIRHGDFLLVMMARLLPNWLYDDDHNVVGRESRLEKNAQAINLAKVIRLTTEEGQAPNRDASASLFHSEYSDEPFKIVSYPPMRDFATRSFLAERHDDYFSPFNITLDREIKGFANFARDDAIQFVADNEDNTILSVPFGTADRYLQILLTAIREGWLKEQPNG